MFLPTWKTYSSISRRIAGISWYEVKQVHNFLNLDANIISDAQCPVSHDKMAKHSPNRPLFHPNDLEPSNLLQLAQADWMSVMLFDFQVFSNLCGPLLRGIHKVFAKNVS